MREAPNAPTAPQRLLLRAALLAGDEAANAWRDWLTTEDLDDIDGPSFALLPLVSHNLQAQGVSAGPLGRLHGVWRQAWYKNQLRLAELAAAVNALAEAGAAGLVIGDAALAARIYAHPGLRPIEQLDVLVRPAEAGAAHNALAQAGWQPGYLVRDLRRQMAIRPSGVLTHAQRQPLHLHWRLFATDADPAADDALWATAQPLDLPGAPAHTPHAFYLLLHAGTAGAVRPDPLALNWLADSATLLRQCGAELSTEAIWAEARPEHRATLAGNLRRVQEITALTALPAPLERMAQEEATDSPPEASRQASARGALAGLSAAWRRYRQLPRESRRLFAPLGFLAYLQSWWNLAHPGQVAGEAWRRLGR